MARLFLGQREADFFADITKELIKDVAGQKIYYYTVRNDLSNVHDIYEEAVTKVFNPPIEIEALVEWQPSTVKTTKFGHEQIKNILVYVQNRDLIDRNLEIDEGSYISYGEFFFEITSVIFEKVIYGQVERVASIKINARQTRVEHILKKPIGPTYEGYLDSDAIQTEFSQQRGENSSDIRRLKEDKVISPPITGAKKVSADGTKKSINGIGSSFYGDE